VALALQVMSERELVADMRMFAFSIL